MQSIISKIIEFSAVSEDDVDVYTYALKEFFKELVIYVASLAIGFIMGTVIETFIFLTLYMHIRKYVGGYHARTPKQCFLYSVLSLVFLCIFVPKFPVYLHAILIIVSAVLLFLFAPVEHPNKPLTKSEKQRYRRKAIIIFVLHFFLYIIFITFKLNKMATGYIMNLTMLLFVVIVGKIKN